MPARSFSLSEQITALDAVIASEAQRNVSLLAKGKTTVEEAEDLMGPLRAARATLAHIEPVADEVRKVIRTRLARLRAEREIEELSQDPAVSAVLDPFPGSEVADVREIETEGVD